MVKIKLVSVKKTLVILLIVLLSLSICSCDKINFGIGGKTGKEKKEDYFKKVTRGDLDITVKATGTIEPRNEIKVKSEASGRIEELYIDEGMVLNVGDPIAKLNQETQKLAYRHAAVSRNLNYEQYLRLKNNSQPTGVRATQTATESAKIELTNLKRNLERVKELHEKQYASDAELEQAQKAYDTAKLSTDKLVLDLKQTVGKDNPTDLKISHLQYQMSLVELDRARKSLGDSEIHSPIAGTVLSKMVNVGDSVISINGGYGEGTTLCTIADLDLIQIRATVDEVDIGRITKGLHVEFDVDSYPGKIFEGALTNIYPKGSNSGGVVTYTIIVTVENKEKQLLPGMTANLTIKAESLKQVLLIPFDAIRSNKNGETIVYVKTSKPDDKTEPKTEKYGTPQKRTRMPKNVVAGSAKSAKRTTKSIGKKSSSKGKGEAMGEERVIKLGATDFERVQVVSGLKEGEEIQVKNLPDTTQMEMMF